MKFTNLGDRHFTTEETTTLNAALVTLEAAFSGKLAVLTPEQRQQYGSVNEQNKLIINKVKDYHEIKPELSSPDVDWIEFKKDFETRAFLQSSILRLQGLIEDLSSAKMLYDWDNYQASLADYDFSKYKHSLHTEGYKVKIDEVAQFFTGGTNNSKAKNNNSDALVSE